MNLFCEYPSNSVAGTCNNSMLRCDASVVRTGRVFYRVREAGAFDYRFFFCNAVDSTFADGADSRANMLGDEMEIIAALAGDGGTDPEHLDDGALCPLTFDGSLSRTVQPGESYWSDDVPLDIPEGHYLVFQWTVRGKNMPYTPDKIIPCYMQQSGEWVPSRDFPQPCLVGCRRPVRLRVAFLGDSITQGLGTRDNYYEYWVAQIARRLPSDIAVWDIGLGFGRAQDAALNGVWMQKAQTADFVSVCFGVNDIGQGRTAAQIQADLLRIVQLLKQSGVRVGIFTIPPFDYPPEREKIWRSCCDYIRTELAPLCEYCIDTGKYWGQPAPNDHMARFGGHPSGEGCALLANAYVQQVKL